MPLADYVTALPNADLMPNSDLPNFQDGRGWLRSISNPDIVSLLRAYSSISLQNTVLAAVYLDPPTADINFLVTAPHAWADGAVDVARTMFDGCEAEADGGGTPLHDWEGFYPDLATWRVVDAAWCPRGGVAVMLEILLERVLQGEPRNHSSAICGLNVGVTSVCTTMEFNTTRTVLGEGGINLPITLTSRVMPRTLDLITREGGCNRGTLLYFPGAPTFNSLVRRTKEYYAKSDSAYLQTFYKAAPKITARTCAKLFPKFTDFSRNQILEDVANAAARYPCEYVSNLFSRHRLQEETLALQTAGIEWETACGG